MKCKCGHADSHHIVANDRACDMCSCARFHVNGIPTPRPRRRAKPFGRWEGVNSPWGMMYDGMPVTDMTVVAKLLNAHRVVLKRGRS